jgi:hypothetical protein
MLVSSFKMFLFLHLQKRVQCEGGQMIEIQRKEGQKSKIPRSRELLCARSRSHQLDSIRRRRHSLLHKACEGSSLCCLLSDLDFKSSEEPAGGGGVPRPGSLPADPLPSRGGSKGYSGGFESVSSPLYSLLFTHLTH